MHAVWIQNDKTIEGIILATSREQAEAFQRMLRRQDRLAIYDVRIMAIDTLTDLLLYVAEETEAKE